MLDLSNKSRAFGAFHVDDAVLPPRDPRFVHEPSSLCQLATKWDGTVPAGGLVAQEKIDGIRALWIEGRLITREGNEIGGTDHITTELRAIEAAFGCRMFLDGEFQLGGALKATMRHFASGGRYGDGGRLYLFDALPLDQWRSNASTAPLSARLDSLSAVMAMHEGRSVSMLPSRFCSSLGAVRAHAEEIWARGGEGLVLKTPGSPYRRMRSSEWMKLKGRWPRLPFG